MVYHDFLFLAYRTNRWRLFRSPRYYLRYSYGSTRLIPNFAYLPQSRHIPPSSPFHHCPQRRIQTNVTVNLTLRPIVSPPPSSHHFLPILPIRPSPARTLSLAHCTFMPRHGPLRASHPSKESLQPTIQHAARPSCQRARGVDQAYGEVFIGISERGYPGHAQNYCWEKKRGHEMEMRCTYSSLQTK